MYMLHYFYVLNESWLRDVFVPALAASWRARSFGPCQAICGHLLAKGDVPDGALLRNVAAGLSFDQARWHALVDECLIFGADAMPQVPCLVRETLCLLAPDRLDATLTDRAAASFVEQVYYGSRDLRLGGAWHRPEHVGWNDILDIHRLGVFLHSVDPATWSAEALAKLGGDDQDRMEELAYVRDWWPALVEMYDRAHVERQVIVCERVD